VKRNLAQFNVPARFLNAYAKDFPPTIRNQVGDPAKVDSYFITGPVGTGKTRLAVAILRKWINGGRAEKAMGRGDVRPMETSALFVSLPDLLEGIRASFSRERGDGRESEASLLWPVTHAQALILDDMGAEKKSEWSFSVVYTLIGGRYNSMRPTIVTSNMGIDEIKAWEPRIASRLGSYHQVDLNGPDRRSEE